MVMSVNGLVITVLKRTMFNATDSLDLVNVVLSAVLFI